MADDAQVTRKAGMTGMDTCGQVSIKDGLPHVEIRVQGTDGSELRGRISPGSAITCAASLMAAATAAETEAAMIAELRDMGLDDDNASVMLMRVRQRREELRPDAEAKFDEIREEQKGS